jgi:glycosyltransferase involved in cell wall biosynthesis
MINNDDDALQLDWPTITALLIVHNEERFIRGALESIADVVDRMVVVHDGPCNDATMKIAREYTDDLRCTPENSGSAEFVRPLALAGIDSEWVLNLDADERLSPELRQNLRSLTADPNADSYGFSWPYVDESGSRIESRSLSGKRFLFRRSKMYTIGLPHMTPDSYERHVSRPDLEVWHLTKYASPRGQFRRMLRVNRIRARQAAQILARGIDSVGTFNVDLTGNRAGNVRKLRLFASQPLIALLVVPPTVFLRRYFLLGYFRAGITGLHDALNIPVYYAWLGLYRIRDGLKGIVRLK